jgi:nucleotide-binding universal stress UspA family protein
METPTLRLVVGLDLSPAAADYAPTILEHAFDQAAGHDRAIVHVVTCVAREAEIDAIQAQLVELVDEERRPFGDRGPVRLHVIAGDPAEEIPALADEIDADLVVIGRFRSRALADRLLDEIGRPTLVVQLADRDARTPRCEACATARRASDGERWFCAEHVGVPDHLGAATTLLPHTDWSLDDRLLW